MRDQRHQGHTHVEPPTATDAVDSDWVDLHTSDREREAQSGPASMPPKRREPRSTKATARTLDPRLPVLAALALEALVALGLLRWLWPQAAVSSAPSNLAPLALTHLAAAALAWWGWWLLQATKRRPAADPAGWQLLSLGVVSLGPLGAVGALISTALKRWFMTEPVGRAHEATHRSHTRDDGAHEVPSMARRLQQRARASHTNVSPFDDVMAQGSADQKRQIIEAIVAHYQPSFARTLRRAVRDTDPSVRMLAAAAASRLEQQQWQTAMQLDAAVAKQPDSARARAALAQHYDEFASSGLLDPARTREMRETALVLYRDLTRDRPNDLRVALAVIRLLMKLKREDEAIQVFRPLMEAGRAPASMVSWFLECLYRRRRFGELRRFSAHLCSRQRDLETLHQRSVSAAHLWARDAARLNEDAVELDDEVDAPPRAPDPREPMPWPEGRRSGPRSRDDRQRDARSANVLEMPYFAPRWGASRWQDDPTGRT